MVMLFPHLLVAKWPMETRKTSGTIGEKMELFFLWRLGFQS